jgi:hypothetical protein
MMGEGEVRMDFVAGIGSPSILSGARGLVHVGDRIGVDARVASGAKEG